MVDTLAAIRAALNCQPGDLLEYHSSTPGSALRAVKT